MNKFYVDERKILSIENITWSVIGKQTAEAKKVYLYEAIKPNLHILSKQERYMTLLFCFLSEKNLHSPSFH